MDFRFKPVCLIQWIDDYRPVSNKTEVYATMEPNRLRWFRLLTTCKLHWTKIWTQHVPWAEIKDPRKCSICTKSLFLSNVVHKFVYIPSSEHFYIAKIIHPPDRCGISRSWLNSMIITRVSYFGEYSEMETYMGINGNICKLIWIPFKCRCFFALDIFTISYGDRNINLLPDHK